MAEKILGLKIKVEVDLVLNIEGTNMLGLLSGSFIFAWDLEVLDVTDDFADLQ